MNPYKLLVVVLLLSLFTEVYTQHNHTEKNTTPVEPIKFDQVISQVLSDPELKDYEMESLIMTLEPRAVDTVAHRHDCELFGFVLEGDVQVALVTKEPKTFSAGQIGGKGNRGIGE